MSSSGTGKTLAIRASGLLTDAKPGDSIAVNGVCLTVTGLERDVFHADAARETLSKTNLGGLRPGSMVNLERSLALGDRMHGHIVQGHIDCTVGVKSLEKLGDSVMAGFELPDDYSHLVVERGSVALDGVSLTVAYIKNAVFFCSLIGFTLTHTNLSALVLGDTLNLETDIIGRYVRKMLETGTKPDYKDGGHLDENLLKSWGY